MRKCLEVVWKERRFEEVGGGRMLSAGKVRRGGVRRVEEDRCRIIKRLEEKEGEKKRLIVEMGMRGSGGGGGGGGGANFASRVSRESQT